MAYTFKRSSAPRQAKTQGKQPVSLNSGLQPKSKLPVGKTLAVIGLILIPIVCFVVYYLTQQTKVSFNFNHITVTKPQAEPIDAFRITVTNTGNKAIIIKKLEVIQGLNGEDLYAQYKWEYMGRTLKAKNNIKWNMEFGNKNLNLLSFRVQLTTADGEVYTSARQPYK